MKYIEIFCNDCPFLLTIYVEGVEILYCGKYKTNLSNDGVTELNAFIEEREKNV